MNDDIVNKYFDLIQNEIKKLISEDKEIKQSQIEQFNDEIFNQPEEIQDQIRQYIDKAATNNLDIKKVAKIIYDKFKLQVKNNIFNQKDSQSVPNPMVGEKKHIKSFENFVNEYSEFHSQEFIDDILQKIHDYGYESLHDTEKAILINFSKDDEDIHGILMKIKELSKEFVKINQKILVLTKNDDKEKLFKKWSELNSQMTNYENMLRYLYQIEDPTNIVNYIKKHNKDFK